MPSSTEISPHTISQSVPRQASFDDLRVGQLIAAVQDGSESRIGVVAHVDDDAVGLAHIMLTRRYWDLGGEVTILRDAPAPPVTIRREDYDALLRAYEVRPMDGTNHPIYGIARALIDNADTGTTDG